MLKHFGVRRTYAHNFKLAILLSHTAGFVNAAGFLGLSALTTNITGHAALFAEAIARKDWQPALNVAQWMLLFLAGAFSSSLIVNKLGHNARYSFVIPIFLETLILLFCALSSSLHFLHLSNAFLTGSLLFGMGMQNALVSVISGSVVRTTHLTGTFTDLGIELALIKFDGFASQSGLLLRIMLRVSIIIFFMLGALSGAYMFSRFEFKSFLIPVAILCFTLLYDIFRLNIKRYCANFRSRKKIHTEGAKAGKPLL